MGGEDTALFLARVPGAFAVVGSAPVGKPSSPRHSPTFAIDEAALIGAEVWSRSVLGS
jgi:metal-dependent amidase/aminoacylase/carboxypeptidase family protein